MEENCKPAVLICGYCKKETELSHEVLKAVMDGKREIYNLCSCGHVSYCSSIRASFLVDTKGWRACYGRAGNK